MKYLIVGLGNPEKKYENTYHNIGKTIILKLAKYYNLKPKKRPKLLSCLYQNKDFILSYPLVYMNESGKSVIILKKIFNIKNKNLIIIHDDNDLYFGKIKISYNKGAGGHKGVESIIRNLKTKNFIRIRIGIQPLKKNRIKAEKFILKKIPQKEKIKFKKILKSIVEAIKLITNENLEKAMNQINK